MGVMGVFGHVRFALRSIFRRSLVERELETELDFHLEQLVAENVERGMGPEAARSAALRTFGRIAAVNEDCRASIGLRLFDELATDGRYAVRLMARTPGLSLAVGLTVALAIAANTTMFSVMNAVLLRPLPFHDPAGLVQVAEKNDKLNLPSFGASVLNFVAWRERTRAIEDLAAVGFGTYTLVGNGDPEQLAGNRISPALMRVLGLTPVVGRAFFDNEEKPGAAPVVMIGEGLWRRRFGADAHVVGRTVTLNDVPTTIVGVAPAALNLLASADLFTPLVVDPAKEVRLNHVIFVLGRLRAGVSVAQAQADMDGIAASLGHEYPAMRDWGIRLITLRDTFVTPSVKTAVLVLFAAVVLVLLIACANIANLLLARASSRQRELATRAALGASRRGLLVQLLIESLTLAVMGGAVGLAGAVWAIGLFNRAVPPNLLPVPSIQIDGTVLSFVAGLTLLTGLLFGLAPAVRASTADAQAATRNGGRGASAASARTRRGLAALEVALATMLLIGAGLLVQSFVNLQRVPLGFDPDRMLTFQLSPPPGRYPAASGALQFYRALLVSLRSIPGVAGAAVSSGLPFGAGTFTSHPMLANGPSALPPGTAVPIDWRIVSPGYFGVMGIPVLRGRDFTEADAPTSAPVVVVSQATARKFWGGEDPIGRTLARSADPRTPFTVVGVVGDVRSTVLTQESPALYYSSGTRVWPLMDVAVRSAGRPDALLPVIRDTVKRLDPQLALANVRTMNEWLVSSAAQPRLNTVLLTSFAVGALLIASIGIYGVLAFGVTQRTREIGIRIALGAEPSQVMQMIIREGMSVGVAGVSVGVIGALIIGRSLAALVYGVDVRDPTTFVGASLFLAMVALGACIVPARRAARVDPIVSLRCE